MFPEKAVADQLRPEQIREIDIQGPDVHGEPVFQVEDVSCFYGSFRALRSVSMEIQEREVTALIGPSGCGKTTFLRCLNRMNDMVPNTRLEGHVSYRGEDLYGARLRPMEIRRKIGMVFQRPNPFPKSIYENVAFAPRLNGVRRGELDDLVELSLRRAALWDEVKDKLKKSAFTLSGGQQQRLCIARAIAVKPDVILMDEPASALDPIATRAIEELMRELADQYTIVIVTHNLAQALRVADNTAFFTSEVIDGDRTGVLVELGRTEDIFASPQDERTADYVAGRFG
ncbi:MAG TPA: phosphate ABC transporter ATP-binding protein PstB [Acidimicrobiales bacterium]|nr:phosphate ABC transporter ATP-binding protein PstB [Acidimicrobiales bacterium]